MDEDDPDRGGDDRRSPVGDFLIGALSLRGEEPLAIAELMEIASDNRLNISTVLAWVAVAEEGDVIEQLPHPDDGARALRLTARGAEIAGNNRRGIDRHAQRPQPPDDRPEM